MTQIFTQSDTWSGGFYELNFELPSDDQTLIRSALATLWAMPQLVGGYLHNDIDPANQSVLLPQQMPLQGHLYGVATLPNGRACACGSIVGAYGPDGTWVSLYLPLGALEKIYPLGGYPFGPATPLLEQTLQILNEWLRTIAEMIYQHLAFTIAVIGFESEYVACKHQIADGIPAERWDGILLPQNGQLHWYPPTEYGP